MVRAIALATAAVMAGTLASQAQPSSDSVSYHYLATSLGKPFGSFPEAWMVVTESNSLALFVVPQGYRQKPHHHEQEQFLLGVEGALDYSIDGTVHRIGPMALALPPANVAHGMINEADHPALAIEFQPVRRDDWLPPYPQVRQPQVAQPMILEPGRQVTLDWSPSSTGWQSDPNGAKVKTIAGATIRARFYDLSAPKAEAKVAPTPLTSESFVFVLSGRLTAVGAGTRREVTAKTTIVVRPTATDLTLESTGQTGTLLVLFERITRSAA
jgi:quercetin dioxygenase-like cupin family protein